MVSLPNLTQMALNSLAEWGQEFSLVMNAVKTMDIVIGARWEQYPFSILL